MSHSAYQVGSLVLQLRDDVNYFVRETAGTRVWVVEDPRTSRYHQIGEAEYTFLTMLDGKTTLASALGQAASVLRDQALTLEEAATFGQWLVHSGLASTFESRSIERTRQDAEDSRWRRSAVRGVGPISQKIPLINPDAVFRILSDRLGFLISWPALLTWCAVVAMGVGTTLGNLDGLRQSGDQVIAPGNWFWFLMSWLGLRLIHESAHGIACRRFGGNVREAGILFILFVPLPYVDVTSAWSFSRRRHRILVSAAGMAAEVFVAALSAIVWAQSEPGILRQQAFNLMLAGSATTVLFNANPLMRFDGYYLLIDLLDLPNLATRSQQWLRSVGRWVFFGFRDSPPDPSHPHRWLIPLYAIAAAVWRVLICVGLILAADSLFYGAGIVLAGLAGIAWGGIPLARLVREVTFGTRQSWKTRLRFLATTTGILTLMFTLGLMLTFPERSLVPAVVGYYPLIEVRTSTQGFVTDVLVNPGDQVDAGEILLTLNDPELKSRIMELRLEIQKSQIRSDMLLNDGLISAWQAEQEREAAQTERLRQLLERERGLAIRAPISGTILTPNLPERRGRFLQAGELTVTLGGQQDLRILAYADQRERDQLQSNLETPVEIHIDGGADWTSNVKLLQISDRAQRILHAPPLGAQNGGPLPVRMTRGKDQAGSNQSDYELLEPRYLAQFQIPDECRRTLRTGQTAYLLLSNSDTPLGTQLWQQGQEWWSHRQAALLAEWRR
ncbi:MAG: HlyD family efflux transporter periplasmic adaptor subunit [Planctomycetaceae bacterium]|nr:HlyD family efflux transporter periplasmic adaptor subunit [Planctomycetaceae bacterium]